jgi:hypothetical protein
MWFILFSERVQLFSEHVQKHNTPGAESRSTEKSERVQLLLEGGWLRRPSELPKGM